MANSLAVTLPSSPDYGGEDIGARLSRLGLPVRPLIMDKVPDQLKAQPCPHLNGDSCYCYEYTTLLDRPDYRWRPESPDPEAKAPPKKVNGSTAPKKKITLGQYSSALAGKTTKKGAGSSMSPGTATATPNGTSQTQDTTQAKPAAAVKKDGATTHAKANGVTRSPLPPPPPPPPPPTTSKDTPKPKAPSTQKRPTEPIRASPDRTKTSSQPPKKAPTPQKPLPKKRPRSPSPPPPPPPKDSPPMVLPPLLDGNLGSPFEAVLAREQEREKAARSSAKDSGTREKITVPTKRPRAASTTSDRSVHKNVPSGKKLPAASSISAGRSPRPKVVADSPSGKTLPKKTGLGATASKTLGKRQPSPRPAESPRQLKSTSSASKHPAGDTSRKSLVVKLKFKKSRFKDVLTLQKLSANKRPRQDDESVPATKRPKPSGGPNTAKATIARSPAFKSPARKPPREAREAVTPPRKANGTGPAALRRTELLGTVDTPSTREERNGVGRGGQQNGSHKALTNEVELYVKEYNSYSSAGREAKHEADRIFKRQPLLEHNHPEEARKALVSAVDSTLCFTLAFILQTYSRHLEQHSFPTDIWRSFLPLLAFVSEKAKMQDYPMHGFCRQLEALVRQHVFDHDLLAFSKAPLPVNNSKAPTPDGSTSGIADRGGFEQQKVRFIKDTKELKECWLDGMKYLSYDEIQAKFPQTYQGRSKTFLDPNEAWPKTIGRYTCDYVLPLHRNSSLLEAVNFGRIFLEEWAKKNGVKYTSKLASCLPQGKS